MTDARTTNRKLRTVALVFLLIALAGGGFFYVEVRDTLHLIKSEHEKSNEFTSLMNSAVQIRTIPFADIADHWQDYVIIDVRETEEYNQGRIRGALNYRLGELLNSEQVRREMIHRSAGRKRVFFCHDGDRSTLAASMIETEYGGTNYVMDRGFRQIQNDDGYKRYWEGSTRILPLEENDEPTPWLRWKEVTSSALVELSLQNRPPYRTVRGKTIIHAPILLMSDAQIDAFINTLGSEPIIALCNSKVSCFSTRIFRYRLEQHGLKLSGFVRAKERPVRKPTT